MLSVRQFVEFQCDVHRCHNRLRSPCHCLGYRVTNFELYQGAYSMECHPLAWQPVSTSHSTALVPEKSSCESYLKSNRSPASFFSTGLGGNWKEAKADSIEQLQDLDRSAMVRKDGRYSRERVLLHSHHLG